MIEKIREILKQMEVSSDTCDIEKYVNLFHQATRLDERKINKIVCNHFGTNHERTFYGIARELCDKQDKLTKE